MISEFLETIQKLRKNTDAPLKVCKKALDESEGDYDKAVSIIQNIMQQDNHSATKNKITNENFFILRQNRDCVCILSIAVQTDFVMKNKKFQDFCAYIADFALSNFNNFKDTNELLELKINHTQNIDNYIKSFVKVIGENINIIDCNKILLSDNDNVVTYVHGDEWFLPNSGKIVSLLSLNFDFNVNKEVYDLCRKLAMQVCAMSPKYVSREEVEQDIVNEQINIYQSQLSSSNKPQNIVDKIVEGKLNKFFSDIVFLEQSFIIQPEHSNKMTVEHVIKSLGQKIEKQIVCNWFKIYR